MLFRFYCDESHDSPKQKRTEPRSYTVGGFFGDERSWGNVERRWKDKNKRVGVERYHAAHLNAATYEFDGWTPQRRLRYSKSILQILKDQKRKLHGVACGLYVDEYRSIISPSGQIKMGHPYLVCFKSVIASVARQMDSQKFPMADTFAVVLDRNRDEINGQRLETEAVRTFYEMKDNPKFQHRDRLETCTPADSIDVVPLQSADFVAYEVNRLMHDKRNGTEKMRDALNSMLSSTGFMCQMFNDATLVQLKDEIEASHPCRPNGLVIIPEVPEGVRDVNYRV